MSLSLPAYILQKLLTLDGVTKLANCRRGTKLFASQDRSDGVYYVESGRIKLLRSSADEKEVMLGIVGSGEILGESSILGDGPREVSAEVLQDSVVHVINRDLFLKFCDEYPQFCAWLLSISVRRQRELERKIELLLFHEVEQRVLRSLVGLAATCGSPGQQGIECIIHLSQRELASAVGSTRETTSSTLNHLSKRGLLKLHRRQVLIPSLDVLREAIAGPPQVKSHSA